MEVLDFELDDEEPKGPSNLVQILIFLALTALAAGVGFGGGHFIYKDVAGETGAEVQRAPAPAGHAGEQSGRDPGNSAGGAGNADHGSQAPRHDGEPAATSGVVIPLDPIVTNIQAPKNIWIRIELAVVAPQQLDEGVVREIHQDLLTYMRTLQLVELDGPSAFLDFKASLRDRANIRSDGKVSAVLIKTLLYE
ncbi:MAG: flagellar basal body-associated FliL family protein [Notoacmeibacter sp.]|nr:flagellar basal body-associated FliL family protein [Notoacmeibacter sp.]